MKKALIYNPYFDTLGGGERYVLEVARVLSTTYNVAVAWSDPDLAVKAQNRFGIKLDRVFVDTTAYDLIKNGKIFEKRLLMKEFDTAFFVSDGSLPFMFAKSNFLHFQVPFTNYKFGALDVLKLWQYKKIIINSTFTKKYIHKTYHTRNTSVLYPPVTMMKPLLKRKIILNVGRFGSPTHPKKQEELIKGFLKLPDDIRKTWTLVLAGGYKDEESYLNKLNRLAGRERVKIITNPSFEGIKKLYGQAKIYWHGAGFGQSDDFPERMEHFGISTVEAMSAGCVPIVIGKGGQTEIVRPGEGFLWNSLDQLVEQTINVINDKAIYKKVSHAAKKRAKVFDNEHFAASMTKILHE